MSSPRPYESELLGPAELVVNNFALKYPSKVVEARLQLLEAAASRLGGFRLDTFQRQFEIRAVVPHRELVDRANFVVEAIEGSGIHPALALSALARERLDDSSRRVTGAYHTDFRLARSLAGLASARTKAGTKAIDVACGAGMLLCALTIEACGSDRKKLTRWLAESVYAADRSPVALRGALLALSSLTNDVDALVAMRAKWLVADSLLVPASTWRSMAASGFDVVVGNPPWEKVKLSRHEYLKARGHDRHYGAEVNSIDQDGFNRERTGIVEYARQLVERYPSLANGEPDLYIAFTTLFERLCKPGGVMAAIVPAGFIRSQGTASVRRHLFDISERVSISVIENRARFFSIDTRFKFLMLVCTKSLNKATSRHAIELMHAKGTLTGLEQAGSARIGRESLAVVRPDVSLPEVRSSKEWNIYRRMVEAGVPWTNHAFGWRPEFCREVDMTRERPMFRGKDFVNGLPLVEGRMVQQHRFGAKGHVSGSGRRALWETFRLGSSRTRPQFRIAADDLPESARCRAEVIRGGFCDITGQTNERSMMAALIPPGVVCGNKVPSVLFPDDPSEDRLYVWAAVMNSIPFDWMLRRVVTTTVNYFLLVSLPMPRLTKDGLPWRRVCAAARELRELDNAGYSKDVVSRAARLRAEIDAELAVAYGLGLDDLEVIVRDFPLADRDQPALPNEERSTITADSMLWASAKRMKRSATLWQSRTESAIALGASAYMPSQFADLEEPGETELPNVG